MPGTVLNLAVSSRTNASMTVTWDVPSVGGATGYNVTLQGGDSFKRESVDQKTKQMKFKDLKAGTEYNVRVVTFIGDQQSTIVEHNFYTGKCEMYIIIIK